MRTDFDYSRVPSEFRRDVSRVVEDWSAGRSFGPPSAPESDLFDRRQYLVNEDIYSQMRVAREAVRNDDVVGGLADVTEALSFVGVKFESTDLDTSDIFNQIAADLDLDGFLRAAYRELFSVSQVVVAATWRTKAYQVRGVTKAGNRKRRILNLFVPTQLVILDPLKIVPVSDILGQDRLYWYASRAEMERWRQDATMSEIVAGPPDLDPSDPQIPRGVDYSRLLPLRADRVWRHCATKSDYQRFPDLRIRSIFPLLDLKQQLISADRAALVGNARLMVLLRKGTDDLPAMPQELKNLKDSAETIATLPVLVGDHRLTVDIVAPPMDMTLVSEKYDTVDRRILASLLGSLTTSSSGQRNESTLTVARMVGRMLESKRHMLKRAIEKEVVRAIKENNEEIILSPSLVYYPNRVELDTDSELIRSIMETRSRGDLSRETALEFLGFDMDVEALRRQNEEESGMDDLFKTATPFDSPENNQQRGGDGSGRSSDYSTA